jgi:hypothetical protein
LQKGAFEGDAGVSEPDVDPDQAEAECRIIDTIDYVHGIGNTSMHSIENVLFQHRTS